MFKQLWKDEEGLTTVEYALLLALVAIAAIAAWTTLGQRTSQTVTTATDTGMPAAS
jgi:Flp pilus assembly pilin Flp